MSLRYGHLIVSGTRIEVFRVHEAEPSFIFDLHGRCVTLSSMAVHLPCLPGSPLVSHQVLTSFVPPAHNQGVGVAPLQGHALWKIFLPTTGSFYVIVCWLQRLLFQHHSADVTWETSSGVGLNSDCCVDSDCIPGWPGCYAGLWISPIIFPGLYVVPVFKIRKNILISLHATVTIDCIFFSGFFGLVV